MEGTIKILKDEALDKEYELILSKGDLYSKVVAYLEAQAPKTKISGFRPGKIPLSMLFQQYGHQAIDRAIQDVVSQKAKGLVGDHSLATPLSYHVEGQPEFSNLDSLDDIRLHIFAALKPLMPEISWKKIYLVDYQVKPTEEEVEQVLQEQAAQSTTSIPLEQKRPAQAGDTLIYEMQYMSSDGHVKDVEGAFQLGSGTLPEEFEKTLIGISEGHVFNEKLRVPKTFPEKSLAGKKVNFRILFTEIRQTVPHQVNDAFAQSQGAKDLDDYREKVRKYLVDQAKPAIQAFQHHQLIEQVKALLNFDVPQSMINHEYQRLWETSALAKSPDKKEDVLRGQTEEEYKEDLRNKALANVRLGLVLKDIIHTQKFSVQENELSAYMHVIAQRTRMSVEEVIAFLRRHPRQAELIMDEILEKKALDWACQQSQLKSQDISLAQLKETLEKEPS